MSRLGIIAGGGVLPLRLAEAYGGDVFVLALEGQAQEMPFAHKWARVGQTEKAISILKAEKVDTVVLAGSVSRLSLKYLGFDWRTIKVFLRLGLKAFGDDALLRAVLGELEKEGFKIVGAQDIAPALLAPAGVLTQKQPSAQENADIQKGFAAARALGAQDLGQAVIVRGGEIAAREDVHGTSALLQNARGGILIKACKPGQDRRVDLPAIGPETVEQAAKAGLSGLAVEAGAALILDRAAVIAAADRLGLFVVGYA